MSTARKVPDPEEGGSGPPRKIHKIMFEPKKLVSVSNLDDMYGIITKFQVAKIRERLEARTKEENELRARIEQLEKRQTQDDAVLNVVNRYWNQLNEDIRIMLQRFDTETSDEIESNNENEVTTAFLSEMAKWDQNELDEKLAKKVQVSTRAVTKMVQAFDRLFQRSEKLCAILKAEVEENSEEASEMRHLDEKLRQQYIQFLEENKQMQLLNTSLHTKFRRMSLKMKELAEKLMGEETAIDELKNRVSDLEYEFEDLNTECKKKADLLLTWKDKVKEIEEQLGQDSDSVPTVTNKDMLTSSEIVCLQKEAEELQELAEERKKELNSLKDRHICTLQEIDRLNREIQNIPEQTVMETTEYKCLQSKFSVIYNESQVLRQLIQDVKKNLLSVNQAQGSQVKEMEQEENEMQKHLLSDMTGLEDTLNRLRKEYEDLRVEFEKNAAANEQVAPVHREMRNLIAQLQQANQQIKQDAQKMRSKSAEVTGDNAKARKYNAELIQRLERAHLAKKERRSSFSSEQTHVKKELKPPAAGSASAAAAIPGPSSSGTSVPLGVSSEASDSGAEVKVKKEEGIEGAAGAAVDPSTITKEDATKVKIEPPATSPTTPVKPDGKSEAGSSPSVGVKTEGKEAAGTFATPAIPAPKKAADPDQAQTQELKQQLKKCMSEAKEMKLLLDMYKGQNREQTDKVELMVTEKKAKIELEELKQDMKRMQENQKKEEKKKVAEEDLSAKIKVLEERTSHLRRQIGAQKQEEEALLNEMDVTGQAFEDMQEQNSRLIQQLREKENANFKLMSDRIKANRVQELLKEEKEAQQKSNQILMEHLNHKSTVIRKLEEIEQQLVTTISIMEKEAMVRQQAMELNKRKAIESAQSAADLKLHLEKYHSQMKEAQQLVAEKTSALAAEAFKSKRYSEELSQLNQKLDRLKKIEISGSTDEVVLAEIQEYKDMLTCPSCKVRKKDAVLTKCFHVFCFDCLRTRYETRQRKCPRCNAAFGANDYHRLYLS